MSYILFSQIVGTFFGVFCCPIGAPTYKKVSSDHFLLPESRDIQNKTTITDTYNNRCPVVKWYDRLMIRHRHLSALIHLTESHYAGVWEDESYCLKPKKYKDTEGEKVLHADDTVKAFGQS